MASKSFLRGANFLFQGVRIGNSNLAGLGAAMIAFRLIRRRKPEELLFSTTLKPGQGVKIVRPETGEAIEIR